MGQALAMLTASSKSVAFMVINPAIDSFISAKGPSVITLFAFKTLPSVD